MTDSEMHLQAEVERQGGAEDMAAAGICQRATEEI
jgi:hypothetical protein